MKDHLAEREELQWEGVFELLQDPEKMTPLVSCGTVGHRAFAEGFRGNIRNVAEGLHRAQTCLAGGVIVP